MATCWLRIHRSQHAPGVILEKVCENALAHELGGAGLAVVQQRGIRVHFNSAVVGVCFADLLIEDV